MVSKTAFALLEGNGSLTGTKSKFGADTVHTYEHRTYSCKFGEQLWNWCDQNDAWYRYTISKRSAIRACPMPLGRP